MVEQRGIEPLASALRTRLSRQDLKRLISRNVATIERIPLTMSLSATRDSAISLALNNNGARNGELRCENSARITLSVSY
jgi:hypothetical protein